MKWFIREYLLENWTLKATAILLALILWLFVRGEPGPERVVSVPLEVQVPSHMEITNERPTSIEVTMRGMAFSNMWFNQALPSCIINLQNAEEGRHVVTLTPGNVRLPKGSGIEVLTVNPVRVTLVLERTISKEVPIAVPIRGEPFRGFEVYGKISKPATVIITGPRSRIESVNEVPTEAVSINGLKQPTRSFVSLNLKDNAIRTSLAGPVQVDVQIGPRRKLYTIAQVPVTTDDESYTATPGHISIQVLASPDLISTLTPADFNATVDTKALDPLKLPVKVRPLVRLLDNLNGAVMIRDIQPPEVVVRRNRKK
jgi:YbbR domain-containing protein